VSIQPTFDERPLVDVRQHLERLVAAGKLEVVTATADDLRRAAIPADAGPVYRALAKAYRTIRLREADVLFHLHEGEQPADALAGWRLRAHPEEIDVRVATRGTPEDDWVVDATWTPHGDDAAVHSTIVHFLVRAAVGDRT
jgi:hypothetical protein